MTNSPTGSGKVSLARQMARSALAVDLGDFGPEVVAKAKLCLLDFLSCAFEAGHHPWSRQAIAIAQGGGSATIVGMSRLSLPADAAFANAVMGHGLVREDMHAASIAHHGVVIWPTLLALSEQSQPHGSRLLAAAIIGYETGARIGRALLTSDLARLYRPTGLVAPLGAALAGSFALNLSEDAATSAIAIAANTSSGLNEWPHAGGSDMYFHPGFAASNAIKAIGLAAAGAFGSETILEGEAGLFAAYGRRAAPDSIALFPNGECEIMAVYNKPVPACNFAQTAAQAALRVSHELAGTEEIDRVVVRAPDAAVRYPGCASTGPYRNALQAKMSIPFSVAATLVRGEIEEGNYAELDDVDIIRLVAITKLEPDVGFTTAFPDKQGADVTVHLQSGRTIRHALPDVIAATPSDIRTRFRTAAQGVLGEDRACRLEQLIESCERLGNAGDIAALCRLDTAERVLRSAS
ncbi:2-methylcitrate dehydratase PrpD [Bradyrhizobium yuanmingense]|uniref:2-methylcitrate dehydratase PrpD n=1 Tax=Bradyrhizobium yuanmingense TaxID=108015 RepID=A0A1C3WS05_9BRAD|nr:MmgE/PrpD family protein [Bradyrhizobium yuanmingense]TWI23294.1 2-methylcitrate dehydratase PrpD [Bradyrhizobium yuanmingense]SCB42739.1 2-methylcitrate dehydratase PrpD [Bradyrhizobium yuanmingense]